MTTRSAEIRAALGHPIIDADGHFLELTPVLWPAFLDTARRIGGNNVALRFERAGDPTHDVAVLDPWYAMSDEERRDTWTACPAWWVHPTVNTLDRATVSLPRLLYERMDELGIDFSIQYPSNALTFRSMADPELRTVGCRAVNTLHAEVYAPYADRMTPAAVVPSHTPEEAIAEAEYAVERLGLKVITLGHVLRPVPKLARERPDVAGHDRRLDALGVDSDHDYDPFWAKCIELGVAPTFHSGSRGWGSRRSVTNFSFNHIGHFSEGGTAICKSLFMAGVTRRFPELRTAFLEGGVSGACSLYAGIVGEWEKRNREALRAVDPSRLDGGALVALAGDYGDDRVRARLDALRAFYAHEASRPFYRDDWAALEVERGEQLRDLFVDNFYFGCEADDPTTAWAFDARTNPHGARLRAMLGSDMGHYDVPDLARVVEEAYELVERGLVSEDDFRDFTFGNAARLHAGMNPRFFDGTPAAAAVEALLGV